MFWIISKIIFLDVFQSLFQNELLPRVPPTRVVSHEVVTEKRESPPNLFLFLLVLVELRATNEYVNLHVASDKIRSNKSSCGASLFLFKCKVNKLRIVVKYCALS